MKIDQELFYASIAKYYDKIFPLNEKQVDFVNTHIESLADKQILDVGCSTGQLAKRLSEAGSQVTGIDLSGEMIKIAQKKSQVPGLTLKVANMLELDSLFAEASLDAVLCFGNTLVHLDSLDELSTFFELVSKILKPRGKLLMQILNYDFILDNKIEELPLIDGPELSFIRKYNLPEQPGDKIIFNTELVLKNSRDSLFHASRLLPLRKEELQFLLDHHGFKHTHFYAGFDGKPYKGNHLPLVVSTERPGPEAH
jgi:2-polyprenyl-3-methyl-5-hydroxy-6-metoxy-1,4-benzoquinol methylase